MIVPRMGLATPAEGPEPSMMALALMAGLAEAGRRVQHFRSRACPTLSEVVCDVTGLPGRHLDSWLMPERVCRALFVRGTRGADLGLVEGTLETPLEARSCVQNDLPGDLRQIAGALDLPMVAVLSLAEASGTIDHLPRLPSGIDGLLLDGLRREADLSRIRRLHRLTGKPPILGALPELPGIRRELEQSPRSPHLPDELLRELGRTFLRHADLGAIEGLYRSRAFPGRPDVSCACGQFEGECCRCFRVAYAHDEAFGRYFPDTFEALEALGAELVEFSPLRDEALPEGADLVMIGCGFPDLHAERLASNLSLMAALRQHVCKGKRIYTEGGGTAYLSRWMILEGQRFPGVGIYPCDAELMEQPEPPKPVTRTLLHDCWLGAKGTVVQGYMSGRWRLHTGAEPFECPSCFGPLTPSGDLLYHHHAVGSLIHLHLGALPEVVAAFAGPHRPSLRRPSFQGLTDLP